MTTQAPTTSARSTALRALPWTTGIRGLACVTVLVYHGLLTAVPEKATGIEHLFVLVLALTGRLSVLAFIILSGYLLGRHWRGGMNTTGLWKQYRQFMTRRSVRVLPPFYVALTLVVLAMAFLGLNHADNTHWDTGLPFTWQRVLTNYTMTTDVFNQVPLSHQLWTVPVEYHLYLLAPFIVLGRTPRTLGIASAITVFGLIALDPGFTAPFFIAAYIGAFWTGLWRQRVTTIEFRTAARTAAGVILISAILSPIAFLDKSLNVTVRHYMVPEAIFALVFLPWLYYRDVMGGTDLLHKLVDLRFMRWLGEISFSLYLIHGLVLELTWRALISHHVHGHLLRVVSIIGVGAITSLIAAVALYRWVEMPSERASRRIRVDTPTPVPTSHKRVA
ncbi:MAG TPA: acyltransferase [Marmoricola sp.]|nr:acyltransferase [Marmoricola sp.]